MMIRKRLCVTGVLSAGLAVFFAAVGCNYHSAASPTASVQPVQSEAVPTPGEAASVASDDASAQAGAVTQASATEPVSEPGAPATAAAEAAQRPAPKDPASTRAPADRAPVKPGDAEKITFDDLNLGMQQDMVFRPFLVTERVKELDGKRVRITGFIHAGAAGIKNIKEFVLLKNTECKFGAGGQADHLAMVYLTPGETTKYGLAAVKVEGTLKVKPYEGADGNTWSVYDLADAKLVQ